MRRSPSPPRKPVSTTIHLKNLVRPFTLGQLKQVLGKSGKIVDDKFWMDKIKSHCFAVFETEDEAKEARQALHGTRWPSSNPKILSVEFATEEERLSFVEDRPIVQAVTVRQEKPKQNERLSRREQSEERAKERESRRKQREEERDKARKDHVREWDRGKKTDKSRSRSPNRSKERHRSSDRPEHDRKSSDRRRREPSRDTKDKKRETERG